MIPTPYVQRFLHVLFLVSLSLCFKVSPPATSAFQFPLLQSSCSFTFRFPLLYSKVLAPSTPRFSFPLLQDYNSLCCKVPVSLITYLLLAECEVRTASYGPSFFLPLMAQARSAWAMKTRKEKTRIYNLPYGPSKRG